MIGSLDKRWSYIGMPKVRNIHTPFYEAVHGFDCLCILLILPVLKDMDYLTFCILFPL